MLDLCKLSFYEAPFLTILSIARTPRKPVLNFPARGHQSSYAFLVLVFKLPLRNNVPMQPDKTSALRDYVEQHLSKGYTHEQILQSLRQVGWSEDQIKAAFALPPPPSTDDTIPKPLHQKTAKPQDLKRVLIISLIVGLVLAVFFKLLLPSPAEQLVGSVIPSNSILPWLAIPLFILLAVFIVVSGLILKFGLKAKQPFSNVFFVSLSATFLSISLLQRRIVSTPFVLVVPIICVLSQLAWYYANRNKQLRLVYIIALLALSVLALRTLSTGRIY